MEEADQAGRIEDRQPRLLDVLDGIMRISTCGMAAVPNIRPSPSDSAFHWPETTRDPGCRTLVPYFSAAAANSVSGIHVEMRKDQQGKNNAAGDCRKCGLYDCTPSS